MPARDVGDDDPGLQRLGYDRDLDVVGPLPPLLGAKEDFCSPRSRKRSDVTMVVNMDVSILPHARPSPTWSQAGNVGAAQRLPMTYNAQWSLLTDVGTYDKGNG